MDKLDCLRPLSAVVLPLLITSMHDLVKDFFSHLHRQHLKALGYTKIRRNFSRKMHGYTERVHFQGSCWNNATGPWRFYVCVGVDFDGLPPRSPQNDFPGAHCWTRIRLIVPKARERYDLTESKIQELSDAIALHLQEASRKLFRNADKLRAAYEKTRIPWLTIDFRRRSVSNDSET